MKRLLIAGFVFLMACNSSNLPDVQHIEAPLSVERFEKDFFEIDTMQIAQSLGQLGEKYPEFLPDFLFGILGFAPEQDDASLTLLIKQFIRDYKPVYEDVSKTFRDMEPYRVAIQKGMKYVKYYFPAYELPDQLITFIGPMDAFFEGGTSLYGDIITQSGLATGLQLHMGADYHIYHSEMGLSLYPTYLSRRFAPEYIPVNALKNVVDDIYPGMRKNNLIAQMVEKGKKLYLLDMFLPKTHDTLKLGYTERQWQGCVDNEGLIWNFFVKNNLLYTQETNIIKNYLNEGPNTPELGEGSPGYIGLFIGRQIVKAFMKKYPETTIEELLTKDAEEIFSLSKYKPK